ncbi:unnamed protein product [Rotaria socialis]
MITLDDEDEIPVIPCSNKIFIGADEQSSLDGTKLNNLFAFTSPHRSLSEAMKVVTSRHDIYPTLLTNDQEEHIYQELNRTNHEMTPLPTNTVNNSASKMYPLVPINCQPLK